VNVLKFKDVNQYPTIKKEDCGDQQRTSKNEADVPITPPRDITYPSGMSNKLLVSRKCVSREELHECSLWRRLHENTIQKLIAVNTEHDLHESIYKYRQRGRIDGSG
jgi:hypothetical protein